MAEVKMPGPNIDLPSNSFTAKSEQPVEKPKVKKVAQGKVITKKKGFGRKFADVFFGEEVTDVKGYILQDVLVPAIKDTISDVVSGGVEMLLFGERRSRGGRRTTNGPYTSYGGYYSNTPSKQTRTGSGSSSRGGGSGRYSVEDVILESRGDAEEILGNMIDTIKDYGVVSVADLYDMVGIPGAFTDNAWGWFDLGNATVRRVREGYLLVLPRAQSIK